MTRLSGVFWVGLLKRMIDRSYRYFGTAKKMYVCKLEISAETSGLDELVSVGLSGCTSSGRMSRFVGKRSALDEPMSASRISKW